METEKTYFNTSDEKVINFGGKKWKNSNTGGAEAIYDTDGNDKNDIGKSIKLPRLPQMYNGYNPIETRDNIASAILTLYQTKCKVSKCNRGEIHRAAAYKFQVDDYEWDGNTLKLTINDKNIRNGNVFTLKIKDNEIKFIKLPKISTGWTTSFDFNKRVLLNAWYPNTVFYVKGDSGKYTRSGKRYGWREYIPLKF